MEKTYKDTLLMPKTDFEMKANLKVKEPLIQKF
jgi:isoleucyl-tRNA synthetase